MTHIEYDTPEGNDRGYGDGPGYSWVKGNKGSGAGAWDSCGSIDGDGYGKGASSGMVSEHRDIGDGEGRGSSDGQGTTFGYGFGHGDRRTNAGDISHYHCYIDETLNLKMK